MKLNKLSQMTDHITNSLMAHLTNKLYFDYQETSEESVIFNEFMLDYVQPALVESKDVFIQQKRLDIEQKEHQAKLDVIVEALLKWLEERKLSKETQKSCLLGNVLEELTELTRAKTLNERVDALCDICVFAINASIGALYYEHTAIYDCQEDHSLFNFINVAMQDAQYDRLSHLVCMCFASIKQLGYDPFKAMHETIKEINSRTGKWDEKAGKFVKDSGVYNDKDSLQSFEKTVRASYPDDNVVFEYRDNEVDVIIDYGKSIYTYKLWYKADYNKCKEQ